MLPRILTEEQEQQLVEWIKVNRPRFSTNKACVDSGMKQLFDSTRAINSAAISKYIGLAGLGKSRPNQFTTRRATNHDSATDAILAAEESIRYALKELDGERDRLQQRILEIDNLAAKYKHT